ncbi:MAG: hypothetical protein V4492_00185 [Chlamydiota bacterium]
MSHSILFSCILTMCAALPAQESFAVVAPGVNITPKSSNSSSASSSDESDSSDTDADPSGTGEVGEDIIIEDEIDTNDDEGVSS